jgi:hypothetical protein
MTRSFNLSVFSLVVAVSASALLAASAKADGDEPSLHRYQFTSPTNFHQPVAPTPVGFGFTHSHSSTVAEGYLRGKAAVIDSLGNFLISQSQAAILFEQARALDRENDLRQTQALHVQQALWREARDANRLYREKRLAEGRVKLAARKVRVHQAVYRVTPTQLNPTTGEIRWPAALAASKFDTDRSRLQELVRQFVSYPDGGSDVASEIAKLTTTLRRGLQKDIRILDRDEYLAAQKFLVALALQVSNVQG